MNESRVIKGKVCCPNHGEPLEGIPQPCPPKGIGMCPVSGCSFEFEIDTLRTKTRKDKSGKLTTDLVYTVTGEEK